MATVFLRPLLVITVIILGACAVFVSSDLEQKFGKPNPHSRQIAQLEAEQIDYWHSVKPVLDKRCVVCHACYDAPCQLKLTAPEGVERGASKAKVYLPERLVAASPTRLFEDAFTVSEWRARDFKPVLNEYPESLAANRQASVMYQLLTLKTTHPLSENQRVPDSLTLGINREQSCPAAEDFNDFAEKNPQWGMPYAMATLPQSEYQTLTRWVEQGGKYLPENFDLTNYQEEIDTWERFFNRPGNKAKLVARYIYEHLFLAHIYFNDINEQTFFKLVRSETPPGQPIKLLPTRRPIDAPPTENFYYRLAHEQETIVSKTHMPYALNQKRLQRWDSLFFTETYEVNELPGYQKKYQQNPFFTFAQLPVKSRYKFMLDEAQFSIMNFIKGPVCRGQAALNVIKDHFWVFFVDPEVIEEHEVAKFLEDNSSNYKLPTGKGDIYLPLSTWIKYSNKQKKLLDAKEEFLTNALTQSNREINLDWIWNGDGNNNNAALTVFRHFDSASVEKGMLGEAPQTAWLMGYTLLERIHYLLVANYDVFGNVGHQLVSRLFMDFLRMEGESSFLLLLPPETRKRERQLWYRDAPDKILDYLRHPSLDNKVPPAITYTSDDPKAELYTKIQERLRAVLAKQKMLESLENKQVRSELLRLTKFKGTNTAFLAQNSFMFIRDKQQQTWYPVSILRNDAHLNITSVFNEKKNLIPDENTLTITNGFVGAYPIAMFDVDADKLGDFVDEVLALSSDADYSRLVDAYGVRRTSAQFWQHSDKLHRALKKQSAIEYGVLDYNRLENR
ncbi:fatty acid cis/trans isomerase CTI [Alteromonadaceae bacterium 2753L.S.0a.02]|nr:fatty acid cis/trans isomerase CTI [Alteromonadaceae bacterium 2753L.S.0a.02]